LPMPRLPMASTSSSPPVCLTLLSSGSWMGGGPLGAVSLPVLLLLSLEEESAGGAGVDPVLAGGFCGGAGVGAVVDAGVDPVAGCVL
jgi:hypothetical protein